MFNLTLKCTLHLIILANVAYGDSRLNPYLSSVYMAHTLAVYTELV